MKNNQCSRASCPANIIQQVSSDHTVSKYELTAGGGRKLTWLEKGVAALPVWRLLFWQVRISLETETLMVGCIIETKKKRGGSQRGANELATRYNQQKKSDELEVTANVGKKSPKGRTGSHVGVGARASDERGGINSLIPGGATELHSL